MRFAADTTGAHSYYTTCQAHEIMFHVSTLLPFENNRQQVSYNYSDYLPSRSWEILLVTSYVWVEICIVRGVELYVNSTPVTTGNYR